MKELFEQQEWYQQWLKQAYKPDMLMQEVQPINWILSAFNWSTSDEGREFWEKADKEWVSLVERNHDEDR